MVRENRVINAIEWDGDDPYNAQGDELLRASEYPGVWIHSVRGGTTGNVWERRLPEVVPTVFPAWDGGMLKARSANIRNGQFYTLSVKAKDIYVGSNLRADFDGTINLPAMPNTSAKTYVYLYQPASGPAQAIAKLSTDADPPDPARSRLISAFGTHNYSEDRSRWGTFPITFYQTGHDVWFYGDAVVEQNWVLPPNTNWGDKSIVPWVPYQVVDIIRIRLEQGAVARGDGDLDYFVQGNIAAENTGILSKEGKGRSPISGNNKYEISLLDVPVTGQPTVSLCGVNTRADVLIFGYRLDT